MPATNPIASAPRPPLPSGIREMSAQQIANHAADAVLTPVTSVDTLARQHSPLPAWPQGLPTPLVELDRGRDGSVTTTVTTGHSSVAVTAAYDGVGYTTLPAQWLDQSPSVTAPDMTAVSDWAQAVAMRACDAVDAVSDAVVHTTAAAIVEKITVDVRTPDPAVLADLEARGVMIPEDLPAPLRAGATFREVDGSPVHPGDVVTLAELGVDAMSELPDFTEIAIAADRDGGYAINATRSLDIGELVAGLQAATETGTDDVTDEMVAASLPEIGRFIAATYDAEVSVDDQAVHVSFGSQITGDTPISDLPKVIYAHPSTHQFADDATTGMLFTDLASHLDPAGALDLDQPAVTTSGLDAAPRPGSLTSTNVTEIPVSGLNLQ